MITEEVWAQAEVFVLIVLVGLTVTVLEWSNLNVINITISMRYLSSPIISAGLVITTLRTDNRWILLFSQYSPSGRWGLRTGVWQESRHPRLHQTAWLLSCPASTNQRPASGLLTSSANQRPVLQLVTWADWPGLSSLGTRRKCFNSLTRLDFCPNLVEGKQKTEKITK